MPYKTLRKLKLDKYETDGDTRENFEAIEEYITNEVLAKTGWEFAEVEINGVFDSSAPYLFKHNASFIPQDIFITNVRQLLTETSVGTVAISYDEIDQDFIPFTCTSPGARVRFFFGTFKEQKR